MKQLLCPDCKWPVTYCPDYHRKEGEKPKDHFRCLNCKEKYDVNFPGFIEGEMKEELAHV